MKEDAPLEAIVISDGALLVDPGTVRSSLVRPPQCVGPAEVRLTRAGSGLSDYGTTDTNEYNCTMCVPVLRPSFPGTGL